MRDHSFQAGEELESRLSIPTESHHTFGKLILCKTVFAHIFRESTIEIMEVVSI